MPEFFHTSTQSKSGRRWQKGETKSSFITKLWPIISCGHGCSKTVLWEKISEFCERRWKVSSRFLGAKTPNIEMIQFEQLYGIRLKILADKFRLSRELIWARSHFEIRIWRRDIFTLSKPVSERTNGQQRLGMCWALNVNWLPSPITYVCMLYIKLHNSETINI